MLGKDGDGTLERINENGTAECWFAEETDTDLITITYWESKTGEECEPTYVEWETADGFKVGKIEAYGGQDCDSEGFIPDPDVDQRHPDGAYDADLEGEGGLDNEGGNTAAISNLQFCVVEEQEIIGDITLSYEDLPKDDSDWDLNDWVVEMNASFFANGFNSDGDALVTKLVFDVVPQARGAADDHAWHMLFENIGSAGTYSVDHDNSGFTDVSNQSFKAGNDVDIEVWSSTAAVLPNLANTDDSCTNANDWATVTVEFDNAVPIDVPQDPQDLGVNASDLFFDPYLENTSKGLEVHQGDIRLVAVPEEWDWPLEREAVWKVYDNVSEDTSAGYSQPSYDSTTWYSDGHDGSLATNCNYEPT